MHFGTSVLRGILSCECGSAGEMCGGGGGEERRRNIARRRYNISAVNDTLIHRHCTRKLSFTAKTVPSTTRSGRAWYGVRQFLFPCLCPPIPCPSIRRQNHQSGLTTTPAAIAAAPIASLTCIRKKWPPTSLHCRHGSNVSSRTRLPLPGMPLRLKPRQASLRLSIAAKTYQKEII